MATVGRKVVRIQKGRGPVDSKVVEVTDLQDLIPDIQIAKKYVHRNIEGIPDFDLFRYARKEKFNVLIEGPTGPGKTTAIQAYAAEDKLPMLSVSCVSGMDKSEMFGKWNPAEDGSYVWQDGAITSMARHGGVLLLNEFNFIPTKMASILYPVLDWRRIITLTDHKGEVIYAHPNFQVFADMNPGYEGTRELNHAIRNRFGIKIQWGYSSDVEKKLVNSTELRQVATELRSRQEAGDFETPISTNMLIEFEKMADDLGYEFAESNFISSFTDSTERDAVKLVFDVRRSSIKRELSKEPARSVVVEDNDENQDGDFDDSLWMWKKELPDGTLVFRDDEKMDRDQWATWDKLSEFGVNTNA